MKVFPSVQYGAWSCECGSTLLFLQALESRPRQMTCVNSKCEHFEVAVFEPVFEAQPVPAGEALLRVKPSFTAQMLHAHHQLDRP